MEGTVCPVRARSEGDARRLLLLVSSHGREHMLGREVTRILIGRGRVYVLSCHIGFALFDASGKC